MYDLVIIISTWDYQNNLEQFVKVLGDINKSKAILLNSFELVMWNINKNYLFGIESKGVELFKTLKRDELTVSDIEQAFEQLHSNELIIKPTVSANSDDTFRIRKSDFDSFKKSGISFYG
ncbi:hypothetical protein ABW636_02105 [Aquimarina sp. 2201CG1-2-11]|uniref:hypothetical protein n=1 Tax=Aquimarina discodermiae TaxID=3231043 RepID=UPI0034632E97